MSKHTQSFLATFLLFPCKKDDKKHSSEGFLMETLTTESTEKTLPSHSGEHRKREEREHRDALRAWDYKRLT